MEETEITRDMRKRRLLFRATHRGTQENDILVGGFVRSRMDGMADDEMDALEQVLELPDVELADWLTGRRPIPDCPEAPMLVLIRDHALARAASRPAVPPRP